MIDYEFTIQRLEKELAHYRDLQTFQQRHLDAHDRSIEAIESIARRTEENLATASQHLDRLSVKLDQLVDVLLRQHGDGHS